MSTTTFRETVALVAAKAKAKLPEAVNGRIEGAVKLVLSHDVAMLDDGTIEVGSSSDPLRTYRLSGQVCTCKDFTDGKAPEGWCRHRIAAGIAKRVRELVPQVPEIVEPWPDNDPEEPDPAPEPSAPLPEAPASVNVRVLVAGREVQWTLRDHDEARLATRLEALLARYPVPQLPAPAAPVAAAVPQCPTHGALRMGKRGWFCPNKLADESWCKSRGR